MKPPAVEREQIGTAAIDLFASGMGAFILIAVIFMVLFAATPKQEKPDTPRVPGLPRARGTRATPDTADARRLLELNRGHWKVESVHNILDNAFDEDRLRIRTGHGPENTTRPRRFAIGVIRSHTDDCVAATMRRLDRNPRRVFDYLRMTRNTLRTSSTNRRTN